MAFFKSKFVSRSNNSCNNSSVASILYILGLFSFCFLPITVTQGASVLVGEVPEVKMAYDVSFVLLILSSSLNPALYVWRMNEVRVGVRLLFFPNS